MEYQINFIISFLLNMFELYIIYRFMTCFFEETLIGKIGVLSVYALRYVISLIVGAVGNYPLVNMVTSFLTMFFIACCYNATISKKVTVAFSVWMCGFVAEAIMALVIGITHFEIWGEAVMLNSFYEFLLKIILWSMSLIVRRFKYVRKSEKVPLQFSVSVVLIVAISVFMEITIFQQETLADAVASPFTVCIVLLNIIIIYLYDSLSKSFEDKIQLKLMEREITSYHNQMEVVQENYEEMRMFRHDYKNRLATMEQMLMQQKIESAREYLGEIIGKLESQNLYSDSGNLAIDSILNYLFSKVKNHGIAVKTDIRIPEGMDIPEDDVVVLIGNLVDNAMEASLKAENGKKEIAFSIGYEKKCLKICVKNTYNGQIKHQNGHLLTSKEDKSMHGIGLRSVDAIVEKYNGTKRVSYDAQEFNITIILYL